MRLHAARTKLQLESVAIPTPGPGQVLLRVHACAVCRTDLHVVDADLTEPKLPLVPGHEVIGTLPHSAAVWIGSASAHGWECPGSAGPVVNATSAGPAGRICAPRRASPATRSTAAMPTTPWRTTFLLRHAGALYRCSGRTAAVRGPHRLSRTGDGWRGAPLGIYGFGAAAHIVAQVARWQGRTIFAFTSPGDADAQRIARELGAAWAGGSDQPPPRVLDAAIIFAPVGSLVPAALRAVEQAAAPSSAPAST